MFHTPELITAADIPWCVKSGSGKKKGKGKGKGKAAGGGGGGGGENAGALGGEEGGEGHNGLSPSVLVSDFVGVQIKVSYV